MGDYFYQVPPPPDPSAPPPSLFPDNKIGNVEAVKTYLHGIALLDVFINQHSILKKFKKDQHTYGTCTLFYKFSSLELWWMYIQYWDKITFTHFRARTSVYRQCTCQNLNLPKHICGTKPPEWIPPMGWNFLAMVQPSMVYELVMGWNLHHPKTVFSYQCSTSGDSTDAQKLLS